MVVSPICYLSWKKIVRLSLKAFKNIKKMSFEIYLLNGLRIYGRQKNNHQIQNTSRSYLLEEQNRIFKNKPPVVNYRKCYQGQFCNFEGPKEIWRGPKKKPPKRLSKEKQQGPKIIQLTASTVIVVMLYTKICLDTPPLFVVDQQMLVDFFAKRNDIYSFKLIVYIDVKQIQSAKNINDIYSFKLIVYIDAKQIQSR